VKGGVAPQETGRWHQQQPWEGLGGWCEPWGIFSVQMQLIDQGWWFELLDWLGELYILKNYTVVTTPPFENHGIKF
jgi:hypothetical protein